LKSVPVRKVRVVDHVSPLIVQARLVRAREEFGIRNLSVALRAPSRLRMPNSCFFSFFLPEHAILHNHRGDGK